MVNVHRVTVKQTGYPGGPGWTSFHFDQSIDAADDTQFLAVHDWINAVKGLFPTTWHAQIEPSGTVLNGVTGELVSFTAVPAAAAVDHVGTSGGNYGAGVAGLCIGLSTGLVNRARKVRGRIFLVPLHMNCWQDNGTLVPSAIADAEAATNALRTAEPAWGVWSRPRDAAGGAIGAVTAVRVNDKAAYLSSRRD